MARTHKPDFYDMTQGDAVALLELPSRLLPASLGALAGREGWWFAYKYTLDALVSEERVVHLVLWFDGERFHALPEEEAEAFAALPAEETQAGPRGATVSIGQAQEEALAALHGRLLAGLQERIGATFDAARDRWRFRERSATGGRGDSRHAGRALAVRRHRRQPPRGPGAHDHAGRAARAGGRLAGPHGRRPLNPLGPSTPA